MSLVRPLDTPPLRSENTNERLQNRMKEEYVTKDVGDLMRFQKFVEATYAKIAFPIFPPTKEYEKEWGLKVHSIKKRTRGAGKKQRRWQKKLRQAFECKGPHPW